MESIMDDCYDEAWLNAGVQARVQELNNIVESGEWKINPDLWQKIFDEYLMLAELGANANTFRTPEFWLQNNDEPGQSEDIDCVNTESEYENGICLFCYKNI